MSTRLAVLGAIAAAGLAGSALAGPAHLQTLHEQCGTQLNGGAAFCGCLQQTAGDTLNENQQAFAAAAVTQNKAEMARVQVMLSADEAMASWTS
jgi:glutamate-1-semialdehyde aminotransferase